MGISVHIEAYSRVVCLSTGCFKEAPVTLCGWLARWRVPCRNTLMLKCHACRVVSLCQRDIPARGKKPYSGKTSRDLAQHCQPSNNRSLRSCYSFPTTLSHSLGRRRCQWIAMSKINPAGHARLETSIRLLKGETFKSCRRTNGQALRGTESATRYFYQFLPR